MSLKSKLRQLLNKYFWCKLKVGDYVKVNNNAFLFNEFKDYYGKIVYINYVDKEVLVDFEEPVYIYRYDLRGNIFKLPLTTSNKHILTKTSNYFLLNEVDKYTLPEMKLINDPKYKDLFV